MSQQELARSSVEAFLADVATASPAPAGMGVSALSGALAAALVRLVANLTAGRSGYEPLTEEMERIIERVKALELQLLTCMDQELAAINKLTEALSLPKGTGDERDEQSVIRRDLVRISARSYALIPLQIGQVGMEVAQLAESVVRYGNQELLADAGTAAMLACAMVKSAALHVQVNAKGFDDEWAIEARQRVAAWLTRLPGIENELWRYLLAQVGCNHLELRSSDVGNAGYDA